MGTMTSGTLSFVLDEATSAIAYNAFEQQPVMFPSLYDVRPAESDREVLASLSGFGQFAVKVESQNAEQDALIQQFQKSFVHETFAKRATISSELAEDNKFDLVSEIGYQMGLAAARTMETKCAEPFNNGFTTVNSEDALSIFNAAHLNVDGGNSQSNRGSTALSQSALRSAIDAQSVFTDYRGEKISVMPDRLVVPRQLQHDAFELLKSVGKPNSANNDLNYAYGMLEAYAWQYLSDVNNWFVMDSRMAKRNWIVFMRRPLQISGAGDLKSGTKEIVGSYRLSVGVRDWRSAYGSIVA